MNESSNKEEALKRVVRNLQQSDGTWINEGVRRFRGIGKGPR